MIRIAAALCFFLTLLCPAFCLADADADCPDAAPTDVRNCEAMTFGAVVESTVTAETPRDGGRTPADLPDPSRPPSVGSRRRPSSAARIRGHTKAPPAATRRALLQSFLF